MHGFRGGDGRAHRRARRNPVIDEDHGLLLQSERRPSGPIGELAARELGSFPRDNRVEITRVESEPRDGFIVVDDDVAGSDGPDREFRIERRTELAYEKHVERRRERASDFEGNGDAATRQAEHEQLAARPLASKPLPELPAGLLAVAENSAPSLEKCLHAREYAAPPRYRKYGSYVYVQEPTVSRMSPVPESEATLATAVAFLRQSESYAHRPAKVEVIETHFAYVFLAGPFVYKLKKPLRFHGIDFTTLALRRANCDLELTLNRRLAEAVYIDVVALRTEASSLVLESPGTGTVVEWLVKMHYLPRERMLDARALAGPIPRADLQTLLEKLAAFYARTAKAPWNGAEYQQRLEQHIAATGAELLGHKSLRDHSLVEHVVAAQRAFLDKAARMLDDRCRRGRIVDAHGDLRPEHILLGPAPQIIDCLEFSSELRLLDTAEEIAFLALECAALGRSGLAREIVMLYRTIARDEVAPTLLAFYCSRRALVRALLSVWHLDEPLAEPLRVHWLERTRWYLHAARAALDTAPGTDWWERL